MVKTGQDLLDFSSPKRKKKSYGLQTEKWYLGSRVQAAEFKQSEENFWKMAGADLETKKQMLVESRVFLAVQFRTQEPASHVQNLKPFWEMPHGPEMLSEWFSWITVDGSDEVSIRQTIEENATSVFNMIVNFIGDKKGGAWLKEYEEVENNSKAAFGNEIMSRVWLLRELAETWKNKPSNLFFVEGKDNIADVSNQPFVHVLKFAQTGEADYDEKLCISVRIGTTLVFNDITLSAALASVIELAFVFNLMYPAKSDDIFQFVQRLLGNYGPSDGARNAQGRVKKAFVDFQIAVGKMVVDDRKGEIVRKSVNM